jgi:hypothetical protein
VTLDYSIDRADFRGLVDAAMRRIPTASHGNWTLRAPVDPGIALIELFAWLLEQRSYWADRASEPLVRAVLAMFGETVHGARSAGVVLTFAPELSRDRQRAFSPHASLPRRTKLRVPETDILFTLRHGLTALALERYGSEGAPVLELEGVAGFGAEDLRGGRPIPLFATHGGSAEVRLGLKLVAPLPAGATLPVSILFELDTAVEPQWSPDAAFAKPPAVVRWEYKDNADKWRALSHLRDGTLGLRRSGVVRFALPADWSSPVAWLRIATDSATFSSPPTLLQIVPNSALASHVHWKTQNESPHWLPLAGRAIQLDPSARPLPARTWLCLTEPKGKQRWRVVLDLTHAGPADRVVTVDRARATIVFGDGLTGRLPRLDPSAASQVSVVYAAGGGRSGNVPPSDLEALDGPLPGARSVVPAIGGLDAETLDQARARATAALRRANRAVTPADHETLARATQGVAVARAHSEVGFVVGECGVMPGQTTVFVVPGIKSRTRDQVRDGSAIEAPAADPGMLDEVRAQLGRARLVGEALVVVSAAYRHLKLRVTVAGAPHDREGLRRRLGAALRLFLDPLLGGEDGTGWPFGEPIRPTALLGVAQREVGDRGDVVSVEVTIDDRASEACEDVAIRPYELVAVDAIDVMIDAATAGEEVGLR